MDFKTKLKTTFWVLLNNFGPIIVFWTANVFLGVKDAIAVSLVFTLAEIFIKMRKREKTTGLFKFSAIVTFVFGAVDLYSQQSFLYRYESTITNLFTAVFFASSLFSDKTIIQEVYEKTKNPKPLTCDRIAYFRYLTAAWVAYFVLKASAYYWISSHYSIGTSLALRILIGKASYFAMLFMSFTGSKKIFPLLKKWRLLPDPNDSPEQLSSYLTSV